MGSEITGNSYTYTVDASHGVNRDGFIAIGSESVVYKGLKARAGTSLRFSCVLKFKPRRVVTSSGTVDRLRVFRDEEWRVFEELRECRSVVRIDDVIGDLGAFSLPCRHVDGGVIDGASYFCVVEEFIDGWNLDEFCRAECWKLARTVPLDNGLSRVVGYSEFTDQEKAEVAASYNYESILRYQAQIMRLMISMCGIMEFVTGRMRILHLDTKPENIMVTRHGREPVLIDFGKSRRTAAAGGTAPASLPPADYSRGETYGGMFAHGTLGYAAPECFAQPAGASRFPFAAPFRRGEMSAESDIFSFGATFWECLNMFELVTKTPRYGEDPHDFYMEFFLSDAAYCGRDLSCTSRHYQSGLEEVVRKCTRARTAGYTDPSDGSFYHSYSELQRDVEKARDSAPTIVREENARAVTALKTCGVMAALAVSLLVMSLMYRTRAFSLAMSRWEELTADYRDTQISRLEELAGDLMDASPPGSAGRTYAMIAAFTYSDGSVSAREARILVGLALRGGNRERASARADEIMSNANARELRDISGEILRLGDGAGGDGFELARAIYDAEVNGRGIPEAFGVLERQRHNAAMRSAVVKLCNVLDNDDAIGRIAEAGGLTRQEVAETLRDIRQEEGLR